MHSTTVKLLSSEQTQAFDEEYVSDELFNQIKPYYEIYSFQRRLDILDVGGGNGVYADRLIQSYLNSHVTVLEPDEYLLGKNLAHERKTIIKGTFQDTRLPAHSFDVIQFNWVLHHFVGENYEDCHQLQLDALIEARRLLKPGGQIVILENFYEGILSGNLPSKIIYELTANKLFTPVFRAAGANTAGIGVCFHSKNAWRSCIDHAGFLNIHIEHCYDFSQLNWLKKLLLGIKQQRVGLIVAR